MAEIVMKSLEGDLVCGICMNRLSVPKTLPCIHTFCEGCLERYVAKLHGKELSCPTCRKVCKLPNGVKGLQSNFHLVNIAEKFDLYEKLKPSKEISTQCEFCQSSPVSDFCEDCSSVICSKCKKQHFIIPALRSHSVIPIEIIKQDKLHRTSRTVSTPCCDLHSPEKLRFYCKTCSKLICRECTVVQHPKPDHQCVEAPTQFENVKQILSKLLQESNTQLQTTSRFLQEGKTGITHVTSESTAMRKEMKDSYENFRAEIESQLKRQLEQACAKVTKNELAKTTNIGEVVSSASNWVTRMQDTQKMTNKVITENNMWDVLAMSNGLIEAFQALQGDRNDFTWQDSDLKLEITYAPEEPPSVTLGHCHSQTDAPSVTLGHCHSQSDAPAVLFIHQFGHFLSCTIDNEKSILKLKKIYTKPTKGTDQADQEIAFHIKAKFHEKSTLKASAVTNYVILGYGRYVLLLDVSRSKYRVVGVLDMCNDHEKFISCLTVSHQSYIYIVFNNEPNNLYRVIFDKKHNNTIAQGGLIDLEKEAVNYNQSLTCRILGDNIKSIQWCDENIIITNEDGKIFSYYWRYEYIKHENIAPCQGLDNAEILEILQGTSEGAYREFSQTQQRNVILSYFTCYVLWWSKSKAGNLVVTQYDSYGLSNVNVKWQMKPIGDRPLVCNGDLSHLLVCDINGQVSTCVKIPA